MYKWPIVDIFHSFRTKYHKSNVLKHWLSEEFSAKSRKQFLSMHFFVMRTLLSIHLANQSKLNLIWSFTFTDFFGDQLHDKFLILC